MKKDIRRYFEEISGRVTAEIFGGLSAVIALRFPAIIFIGSLGSSKIPSCISPKTPPGNIFGIE